MCLPLNTNDTDDRKNSQITVLYQFVNAVTQPTSYHNDVEPLVTFLTTLFFLGSGYWNRTNYL